MLRQQIRTAGISQLLDPRQIITVIVVKLLRAVAIGRHYIRLLAYRVIKQLATLLGNTDGSIRKAGWQLKRKQKALLRELQTNAQLRQDLALADAPAIIHAWIVDTSIEYDGHYIDDFLVVSREVLEIVIRDELSLLRPVGDVEFEVKPSFFDDGFSASRFVEVVEMQLLWSDLKERYANLMNWRNNQ